MARVRTFKNIRMGTSTNIINGTATVGPQTYPAATAWVSSPVPCKFATCVIFRISGTDVNNAIGAISMNAGNTADGSYMLGVAGTNIQVRGSGSNRIDKGGYPSMGFMLDAQVGARIAWDFVQLTLTSNATTAHTGFVVDVDVVYDGDASDLATSAGQYNVVPL